MIVVRSYNNIKGYIVIVILILKIPVKLSWLLH